MKGYCKDCKNAIQGVTSMLCAKTREYIYPPANFGCDINFQVRTLPSREQMREVAKENNFSWYSSSVQPYSEHFESKIFIIKYI